MSDLNKNSVNLENDLKEASELIDAILDKINCLPMCWDEFVGDDIQERVCRFQSKWAEDERDVFDWKQKVLKYDGAMMCVICGLYLEEFDLSVCESCEEGFCDECYDNHDCES